MEIAESHVITVSNGEVMWVYDVKKGEATMAPLFAGLASCCSTDQNKLKSL